jgi:SAM-dependent methyltransferase
MRAALVLSCYPGIAGQFRRGQNVWWAKLVVKLLLARLPISYGQWRRLGLFKHGEMYDPEYVVRGLTGHLKFASADAREKVLLELGPGDSVGSAIVARFLGAKHCYLVDAGDWATEDEKVYDAIAQTMGIAVRAKTRDAILHECRATYLVEGLESLKEIRDASVDFIWSRAVLEHVEHAQFEATMRELRRIMRPDGVAVHTVDLEDHFAHSLNSLRFPARIWESKLFRTSGFYTNRLRYEEIVDRFEQAGFAIERRHVKRWLELPIARSKLRPIFRIRDDLDVYNFVLLVRPA